MMDVLAGRMHITALGLAVLFAVSVSAVTLPPHVARAVRDVHVLRRADIASLRIARRSVCRYTLLPYRIVLWVIFIIICAGPRTN